MRIGPEGRLFHLACIGFVTGGRLFFSVDAEVDETALRAVLSAMKDGR